MEQVRTSDRRTVRDRRMEETYRYSGPERRKLKQRRLGLDRRGLPPLVCAYCGKICGASGGWSQGASTVETTVECRTGICVDCSSTRFPKFYTN